MADENTQQELDETQLADMAAQLDATGEVEVSTEAETTEASPLSDAAPKKDEPAPEGADKSKETEPKTEDKGPGTEAAEKQTDKQQQQEKAESAYQKAQKERERQDRSWQKLEEEKAALRKEREELQAERQKVTKTIAARDEAGHSADDYDSAARQFETQGDHELAAKARAKAQALRTTSQTQAQEAQVAEIRQKWQETVNKVVDERPELKDANSPLGQKVQAALKANPHFSFVPDGFRRAVEHVEMQDKAALVPGLQTEVETLKKEIERLNKLTSISGSGVTQKPGIKSLDEMTDKEREAELTRLAEEADRQGA